MKVDLITKIYIKMKKNLQYINEKEINLAIKIENIIRESRQTAYRAIDFTMVMAYWNIGKVIVEDELNWERAEYGKKILKNISIRLTKEFGKGFDERELRKMCQFYRRFKIRDAVRPILETKSKTDAFFSIRGRQILSRNRE